jgi:predicted DNA repair protein MutK
MGLATSEHPGAHCGDLRATSRRLLVPSSLLALLDDITTILDDVATLTKVATGKTAGVLGDDLALNAQQVTGVRAERELPVVWAVAKGSLVNKAILVPAALLISAVAPWAIVPLLMVGGLFLCYEGAEKVTHRFLRSREETERDRARLAKAVADPSVDLVALEKDKIKGAIRTDFILSAEIIVITLGTVAAVDLPTRIMVMVGIALLMTVGVYGLVAAIVKLDDGGLALARKDSAAMRALGRGVLRSTPWLMKGLSIAGTAAMFLVGGGILAHGLPALHHLAESLLHGAEGIGRMLGNGLFNASVGLLAGLLVLAAIAAVQRLRRR